MCIRDSSGPQGTTGSTGSTGSTGAQGYSGYSGFSGPQGTTGSTGSTGAQGYSGYSGFSGPQGTQGFSGFTGIPGAQGFSGFSGFSGTNSIPQNSQSSAYSLQSSDNGKYIDISSGGVTVPSGVFSAGNVITIYNDSSSNQTITQGSGVTLRWGGTTNTGNRTLANYGICTVLCVGSNTFVISGAGLT